MKKLFYVFLCVTAIAFASCGNKVTNTNAAVDTLDTIEVVDSL